MSDRVCARAVRVLVVYRSCDQVVRYQGHRNDDRRLGFDGAPGVANRVTLSATTADVEWRRNDAYDRVRAGKIEVHDVDRADEGA